MSQYGSDNFEVLKGEVITKIKIRSNERMDFYTESGNLFEMYYEPDCCASCNIEEIHGDLNDILNTPILLAEEVSSNKNPPGVTKEYQDSFTWTFYKLATIKGSVTIRWYGESNGYYSESVTFRQVLHD